MSNFVPKRPGGSTPEARFMQWVYDSIMSNRICETPTAVVSRTTRGQKIIPAPQAAGGALAQVSAFYLKEVHGDYYVCGSAAGVTYSSVEIAKIPNLRHSITSRTLKGNTWTISSYTQDGTYPLFWTRQVSDPVTGLYFDETVIPAFNSDDIIMAVKTQVTVRNDANDDDATMQWLQVSENRRWEA